MCGAFGMRSDPLPRRLDFKTSYSAQQNERKRASWRCAWQPETASPVQYRLIPVIGVDFTAPGVGKILRLPNRMANPNPKNAWYVFLIGSNSSDNG
jgi:hypothetical protein